MGFLEFIIFCAIVLGIAWLGTWALGYFMPGHPDLIDKIIWGLAIVIIIIKIVQVTGLLGHDPQIPHI